MIILAENSILAGRVKQKSPNIQVLTRSNSFFVEKAYYLWKSELVNSNDSWHTNWRKMSFYLTIFVSDVIILFLAWKLCFWLLLSVIDRSDILICGMLNIWLDVYLRAMVIWWWVLKPMDVYSTVCIHNSMVWTIIWEKWINHCVGNYSQIAPKQCFEKNWTLTFSKEIHQSWSD